MHGRRGLVRLALGLATGVGILTLTAAPAFASSVIKPLQASVSSDIGSANADTDSSVIRPPQ
ncbi:hypothetical protein [Actinoplanes subtropicus]|uniref:hypothetical protein n=1 Tax=Actinoplanes subtropicus TaxID=543632 RepID=UPI0004C2F511|nr:hypothetical protein [Actinoplanes subtropicus]